MFIKSIPIRPKNSNKKYTYFRLCESYRIGNSVRHRTILNLGNLNELPDKNDHKLLADYIETIVYKKNLLFEADIPDKIKKLARHYANIIINKKLLDVPSEDSNKRDERYA
ncbi:MAG: hypothetical protein ACP5KG_12910, partial [Myxococcota bacterium]